MFTLARTIFWLGLAFSWIPWVGDDGRAVGPREAASVVARDAASAATPVFAKAIGRTMAGSCKDAPQACSAVAGKALTIEALIEADAALVLAEIDGLRR